MARRHVQKALTAGDTALGTDPATGAQAPRTLSGLLERRAGGSSGRYYFLQDGREIAASLDHPTLRRRARAVTNGLLAKRAPGSRALLLYPPGLDVLPAFFGCLEAGIVAVPVPPPDGVRLKHALPRLQAIVADAEADAILTTAALQQDLAERMADALPGVHWLATDTLALADVETEPRPPIAADDLAYLQYTSGSTGTPRGVMLTHGNVLANLRYLHDGFDCAGDSVSVTWMPYFHDYGLVEGLLRPLYSGTDCYVLSPLTLLKRPSRWLEAISRFGATHSHAPNFAYELCLERVTGTQREDLDLSRWRVAGNGAEPVRAETLRRFSEAFAPCGFRAETFYPAYGLAEATLFVSAKTHGAAPTYLTLRADALERDAVIPADADTPEKVRRVSVGCGRIRPGTDLRIVDPTTRAACPPDRVGEIWVASPSVALGYWQRPEDTEATFRARLADDPAAGPFLRTGDLGFLRDGELHVSGRLKDLIVIAGVNHYPQDIEWTVLDACPDLRREHCAAVSVDRDGQERLVILAEAGTRRHDWSPVFGALRGALSERHGLAVSEIQVIGRGRISKTSSGKVQRRACRQAFLDDSLEPIARWRAADPVAAPGPSVPEAANLQSWLAGYIARTTGRPFGQIDRHAPFADLGLDSRAAVALVGALEDRLGTGPLSPTLLWRHPSIAALCEHLTAADATPAPRADGPTRHDPVAIVGLACRLPGAPDAAAFWELLREGRCAIRADARLPGVEAGFLEDADCFDAGFFGLPPSEARDMDPQQRLLLETAWSALEHARIPPDRLKGSRTGVYIGISSADFALDRVSRGDAEGLVGAYSGTGMAFSMAANRLSYQFDLRGPSLAIDTACSSSLVAVHQACQSLRNGDCAVALAGGVNLIGGPHLQLALERAGMLSPTRRSRTFDAAADGYVRGEGCAVVVLKHLAAARRDGDRILAVIHGSAVTQDGRSNGLTAPNPAAQQGAIRDALAAAGVEADTIGYVEAHGTGTRLGDPIEVEALQAVLGPGGPAGRPCLIGSAKAAIGHLEAAAGIAGLAKAVLCLQHRKIPPQPGLDALNPLIRLDGTRFSVPAELQDFPSGGPMRAGVSSFGFGGTNAHVILEEAPEDDLAQPETAAHRSRYLLAMSAAHPDALGDLARRYGALCREAADLPPAALCRAAATGRAQFRHRIAVTAQTLDGLAEQLVGATAVEAPSQAPGVAFLFTGQGSQYLGMGRTLYESDGGFRDDLDRCDRMLATELDRSLLSVMFGDDDRQLNQTAYTQPALFALEYALARLWQRWGVRPSILLGHSVGEYVAACLAGVFDLETGLRLIASRARLIQGLPLDGAMLAVQADEATAAERIGARSQSVSVAAVNGPRNTVLSGRREALEEIRRGLEADGLRSRYLPVSHAFHSPLLDPILEAFHVVARRFDFAAPSIPLIGNVDGAVLKTAPDAAYWTRHLRAPVRFADGLRYLRATHRVCLEIGPKPLLTALGTQTDDVGDGLWLASLRDGQDDWTSVTETMAALYTAGLDPDWAAFQPAVPRAEIPDLPGYPLRRERFPLPPRPAQCDAAAGLRRALLDLAPDRVPAAAVDVADWAYVPFWVAAPAEPPLEPMAGAFLVLADRSGTGAVVARTLTTAGAEVALRIGDLPEALPEGTAPLTVLCCWPLDLPDPNGLSAADIAAPLADLHGRLAALARLLARQNRRPVTLRFVTGDGVGASQGTGGGLLQATVWGLGRSLRREHPDWRVTLLDVDGTSGSAAEQISTEMALALPGDEIMRRGAERFALRLDPTPLPEANQADLGDTWLIAGGLGRLGRLLVGRLIDLGVRHLLLLGRRAPDGTAAARIEDWRARGVEIRIEPVDVADEAALAAAVASLPRGWPALGGIVHAAGHLDDGLLHTQSPDRIAAVMGPKVLGAWALHRLTATHPVRHFVLLSSASGLLGNPGQAAYGGANSFLDALALVRRSRGLTAQSVSWSAWSDASADARLAGRLAEHGLAPIVEDRGLDAFERALALDVPHLAQLPRRRDSRLTHPLIDGGTAALPAPATPVARLTSALAALPPADRPAAALRAILAHVAAMRGVEPSSLDPDRGFFDQGLDSMNAIELRNRLQSDLGRPLAATLAFDHPTPARLADQVLALADLADAGAVRSDPVSVAPSDGIAIVAMGCRLPGGVTDPRGFWEMLRDGVDAITEIPASRWDNTRFYSPDPELPGTIQTRHGGFVDGIELFDPVFFGISPREARHLDPQQRLLLEVCWRALEQGGIPPSSLAGSQTGVFIGISTNDYLHRLTRDPEAIDAYLGTGNALSVAANRLSFFLGLEGPSLAIDTACSSSLVAIHQACQSLRNGECDMAVAGGVNLLLDPTVTLNHSRARMLAPDGRCKAFGAAADGFVRSEGCGIVVLKRLDEARRDGNRILAVIRGSAVNQDGRTSGLTVPNGPAQERVIRRALRQADLDPADIDYVEAHGTGTALGDPIEAGALQAVFGAEDRSRPLMIGSVKSNIGHLESAAGVVGLQKVVLSLAAGEVPASLHSVPPSPRIDWAQTAMRLPAGREPWPRPHGVRRAGVSSFGFGGTNAHLVVEQAPPPAGRGILAFSRYLLPLSAKSPAALKVLARTTADALADSDDAAADLCFTAACGRDHFGHRLAVLGRDTADLAASLNAWLTDGDHAAALAGTAPAAARPDPTPASAATASVQEWEAVARRYVDGSGPDWRALYAGLPLRRVDLPGHPFERERYWVDAPDFARPSALGRYALAWQPVPAPLPPTSKPTGHWLILSDNGGMGDALCAALEAQGQRCTPIYKAPLNGARRNLLPGDEAAARALLDEIGPLVGVVHLWCLDETAASGSDGLSDPRGGGLASVLGLSKALQALPHPAPLWIVTRDAMAASPQDRLDGFADAALWGFGRSLALEAPSVWGGLLDLPGETPTDALAPLLASVLLLEDGPREAAVRDGGLLAPRLVRRISDTGNTPSIGPDGSYLITGGFGSLGRAIGLWLARRGAGRLLLIGRRGPSTPEARAHVAALRELGARVDVAALDIADGPALVRQIDRWRSDGPPLRGAVHTAGLGERRNLADLTWPECEETLSAKAAGAWALHEATLNDPLDFFLCSASIAGVWGGRHQISYSAANAFLDGLCAHRRALGLPASSLDLGPLADTTLVDADTGRDLRRIGLTPLPVDGLLSHLPAVLETGDPQTVLADVDWPRFAALYRSRRATGLFDGVAPSEPPISLGRPDTGPAASPRAWLIQRLGEVLGFPADRVKTDAPLPLLGIDSLLAMEVRTLIEREFGVTVDLPALLGTQTLDDLAVRLEAGRRTDPTPEKPETAWIAGQI
ncbi:SDR family NAD(P)-dependent oxidoreductase [Thalassobaculum sp. OXR-137]|uniref:SDR family NAD(P)-dependent oxidoreductase n=1 Tax=Thalassobaculum sp. OXR-137 TaxID=3100173 RepID=UPI002AC8E225|nr:SDR family NAD(P)-dependent oxidoreductase [Thalassobaculum sp. OXR-137]WPZ32678.1 SDR family NAD(P)-dependent oxidoreductase [Thalassobaculum sp. OXR-137]